MFPRAVLRILRKPRSALGYTPHHSMDLTVDVERHPTHTLLRLAGSAGLQSMGVLDVRLNGVAAARPKLLIIEMSRLEFLASLDLGLLVRLAHAIRDGGGQTLAAGAHGPVLDALRRTRLDAVIPQFETVEAALASA